MRSGGHRTRIKFILPKEGGEGERGGLRAGGPCPQVPWTMGSLTVGLHSPLRRKQRSKAQQQ